MKVKRFEACSMPEAISQIRAELGDEAMILETRRLRGGLLGLGAKERIEVLAAVHESNENTETEVKAALRETDPSPKTKMEERIGIFASRFSESGVSEPLIRSFLEACAPRLLESELAQVIANHLKVMPELQTGNCSRVALVGPTGVGKTTTVAKLAARYALSQKKRVGLITMDTYRIGAVEQLSTYARVMGIPIEVVQTPEEMALAVSRFSDYDLVLIDTIGRSPQKALHLAEIKAFLNAAKPTETHLVLSAPSGLGYLYQAAERFAVLDTNRLIITKLDEMARWGILTSLTERTGLPVSFITDGQEVPRNLRPANADEIALQILGGVE